MSSAGEMSAGSGGYLRAYIEYLRLVWKHVLGHGETLAPDFVRLGHEAYRQGFADLAERSLRRAVDASPEDVHVQVALGEVMYWRGRLADARRSFESALELDPANPAALLGTAATLHSQGWESEAIYFYLSYLNEKPEDVRAMLSLAAAFQATGQYDSAIEMFERATRLQPNDADIHGQYGRALYELGREDEAADHLRRAAELGSKDTEVYRALGLIFEGDKRIDEARSQYERAIQIDPLSVSARGLLVSLLIYGGPPVPGNEADLALEHATAAVEILRKDGRSGTELGKALWDLGWVHYVRGEWRESVSVSREALEHDSSLTPVRFNLGLALLRAGERQQALTEYRRAVEEVDDALDLRVDGLDDLKATEDLEPELPGRSEALELLQGRYEQLREAGRRASTG